jgi:fatty-acyl-CoA synthase
VTFADTYERIERLAKALAGLGVGRGDVVGTFCWNHQEHVEAYFAVPCMGAVLHQLNIRLFPEQLDVRHPRPRRQGHHRRRLARSPCSRG